MTWAEKKVIAEKLDKAIASQRSNFYGETFGGRIVYDLTKITCWHDLRKVDAMTKRETKNGREIHLERMTPKQCDRAWKVLEQEGLV